MPGGLIVPGMHPAVPLFRSSNKGTANFALSGITRDNSGAPLGGCLVYLFATATNALISSQTSDGSGNFSFPVAWNASKYYVVAYKPGSPDVAGVSLNTLAGNAQGTTPQPTPGWYPAVEASCQYFLDPHDATKRWADTAATTPAVNGGAAGALSDQYAAGVSLFTGGILPQAGAGPLWNFADVNVNGKGSVTWPAGTLTNFMQATWVGGAVIPAPWTRVFIVWMGAALGAQQIFCDSNDANETGYIRSDATTSKLTVIATGATTTVTSAAAVGQGFHIYRQESNGASSTFKQDGVTLMSYTASSDNLGSGITWGSNYLSASATTGPLSIGGDMCFAGALSTNAALLANLDAFCVARWGRHV